MRPTLPLGLAAALLASLPPPALAAGDARATALVRDFLTAYEAVQTFQGRVRSETRKDGRSQSTRSQLYLQKPHFTSLTIVNAPETRAAEGTRLVWYGELQVYVQTRFFGFPIKATPRYDDPRLMGLRGWNMRELSIVSAVSMLRDARTTVKHVGTDRWLDRGMQVIEARGPRLLPGIDCQQIWLDDQLKLPFAMEMYDGPERAFRIEIESFKFDAKLPPDTFKP